MAQAPLHCIVVAVPFIAAIIVTYCCGLLLLFFFSSAFFVFSCCFWSWLISDFSIRTSQGGLTRSVRLSAYQLLLQQRVYVLLLLLVLFKNFLLKVLHYNMHCSYVSYQLLLLKNFPLIFLWNLFTVGNKSNSHDRFVHCFHIRTYLLPQMSIHKHTHA